MTHEYGTPWTEDEIKQGIFEAMKILNIDRMPSSGETISALDYNGLSMAIQRNGGFKHWAKKLSLDTKTSETSLGQEYEEYVLELLRNKGYEVERMSVKHPYDILANQNIKIDVKVSNLYKNSVSGYYTFNLEKHNHNCDLFICVCVTDGEIIKTLVIPSKFLMGIKQLSLGNTSIYDSFKDRFDYIEKYNVFYNQLNYNI